MANKATKGDIPYFSGIVIGDSNSPNYIYNENSKLWIRYRNSSGSNSYVSVESLADRVPGYLTNMDSVGFGIDAGSTNSYIVFRQNGESKYMLAFDSNGIAYKQYKNGSWENMWIK